MRRRDLLTAAPAVALATPSLAQGKKPLRFIPQANLTSVDPIWTTAVVTYEHAYMVYDKLYGWDGTQIRPQMAAGHEVSQDELTWTFTLRDGLMFHDKEPVLAKDCAQSIRRWGSRDSFGQVLMRYVNEVVPVSDKKFEIRLKKRCPQLLFGFGARQSFIMPERVAMTPGTQQITDYTGSGPFRFLKDEWVSGARAAYAKFDGYVPRQEQPSFFAGGKVAHFDRVEWTIQPDPATAAAALQKGETDWLDQPLIDLVPMLNKSPGVYTKVTDKGGWMIFMMLNHLNPPFNNPMVRQAVFAAMDQRAFAESAAGDQASLMVVPTGVYARTAVVWLPTRKIEFVMPNFVSDRIGAGLNVALAVGVLGMATLVRARVQDSDIIMTWSEPFRVSAEWIRGRPECAGQMVPVIANDGRSWYKPGYAEDIYNNAYARYLKGFARPELAFGEDFVPGPLADPLRTELQKRIDGQGCSVLAWSAHYMSDVQIAAIRDAILVATNRRDAAPRLEIKQFKDGYVGYILYVARKP